MDFFERKYLSPTHFEDPSYLNRKKIESPDQFITLFLDARNQFSGFKMPAQTSDDLFSTEQFLEIIKESPPVDFLAYVKSQGNVVSPVLLEHQEVKDAIKNYNQLADSIKDVHSKDDFLRIFEKVELIVFNLRNSIFNTIQTADQYKVVFKPIRDKLMILRESIIKGVNTKSINKEDFKEFSEVLHDQDKVLSQNLLGDKEGRGIIANIKFYNLFVSKLKSAQSAGEFKDLLDYINELIES